MLLPMEFETIYGYDGTNELPILLLPKICWQLETFMFQKRMFTDLEAEANTYPFDENDYISYNPERKGFKILPKFKWSYFKNLEKLNPLLVLDCSYYSEIDPQSERSLYIVLTATEILTYVSDSQLATADEILECLSDCLIKK